MKFYVYLQIKHTFIMAEKEIDPKLVEKIIRITITILTAVLGFFSGVGTASACNIWLN